MKKLSIYLLTFFIISLYICGLSLGQISPSIVAWNAGELSPYMLRRADFAKYNNGCKQLENMFVLSQGPVTRRPGTKYIADVNNHERPVRLIPFEYSKTDSYVLEIGRHYMRFYRNGGQILSGGVPYEITTPFEDDELFDIQYAQNANVMYLVDGNDPPQKLTRTAHTSWTIADVNIVTGPFLPENETSTSIRTSGTTGTITVIADANVFDEEHVGALWEIGHRRTDSPMTGNLTADGNSVEIVVGGDYDFNVQGTWEGDIVLEKSFDSGSSWETVYSRFNSASTAVNEDYNSSESEDDVLYRVTMANWVSGTANYHLRIHTYIDYGVVKIASYVDANEVTAVVYSALTDVNDTIKWSEGYWSDYREWPQTLEFYEQRLFYGGSFSYPQTLWSSRTASGEADDFEDFSDGLANDNDAVIYALPGQNPIQWMSSQTYLLIGTLSGVGRWGSSDDDTPITPTQPTAYRTQARHGAAYIQAILVGDAVLYIERGGQRVREFVYSLERDRYVAPDMTILSEHITGDGIIDVAYQSRPDSVLWCVLSDGNIATLTYERHQDVVGWSNVTTDGDFESVCIIPGEDEDEVWVVVNRIIDTLSRKYIERFQPLDWGDDQEDCFFVDSGLSFDGGDAVDIIDVTSADPAVVTVSSWPVDGDSTDLGDGDQILIVSVEGMTELNDNIYTIDDANTTDKTFSLNDSSDTVDIDATGFTSYLINGTVQRYERDFTNLDHLEAESVSILADGESQEVEAVVSGEVSINNWANKAHIGIPFLSKLETMPLVFELRTGMTAGKKVRISAVNVDFYESLGVQCGTDSGNLEDITFYERTDDLDDPIPLYTGWRPVSFLRGHDRDATVFLQQSEPLPFLVRAICPSVQITER